MALLSSFPSSFFLLSLSLSFTLFSITCSELTEQKQLNIVIYPSITAPCLLLGNSIRLTQIIISSHLSLITLFYFHIFFSSFGSRTSCQRVIQRGMDVSNHHILFRAVAFSEARLIIAVSSTKKRKKSEVLVPLLFHFHVNFLWTRVTMCENPSVWLKIKLFFPSMYLAASLFPCDYFVCLSLSLSLSPSNECVWAGVLVQQVLSVCVRFQKHKEQLTCCRTS